MLSSGRWILILTVSRWTHSFQWPEIHIEGLSNSDVLVVDVRLKKSEIIGEVDNYAAYLTYDYQHAIIYLIQAHRAWFSYLTLHVSILYHNINVHGCPHTGRHP